MVNDVRRIAHDLEALHSHDYGISGGSALHAGLTLPYVAELGDTEETSSYEWTSRLRTIRIPPMFGSALSIEQLWCLFLYAVHCRREGEDMLLVHRFGHGVGDVLARVDVGWLDDQVAHRLADDSNTDGQVTTAEVDIVRRCVRQRRGVVHH